MEEMILVKDKNGIEFYTTESYSIEDIEKTQKKSVEMMSVIVNIFEKHGIDYMIAHGTLLGLIRHKGFIPWDDDCDLFVFDWDYARAIELLRRELPDDMIVHNRRSDPIYWPEWTKIRDLYSDTYESLWVIDRKFKYHGICVDILKVTVVNKFEYENEEQIDILKDRLKGRQNNKHKYAATHSLYRYSKNMAGILIDKGRLNKLEKEKKQSTKKVCIGNKGTIIECFFDLEDALPVKKMVFEGVEVAVPNNPDGVLHSMYGDYMKMPELKDRKPHFDKVIFLDREEEHGKQEK
ncbi:MAG: LicD family protein [Mogibacterium sp.]|nr:LicD family protein [Mogibacterium sp.]MBQ6501491.1 LicD family protein [Mogibacterium sp.]